MDSDDAVIFEQQCEGCLISTDPAKLDLDVIHGFLSQAYWSEAVPRSTLERAIRNSLCFGVYVDGRQAGFARVVTDRATFAYIADVFILEPHRGRGLSKQMMGVIRSHPDLQGLRRWSLATRDAHGLYSQFGFTPLQIPERHMEILDLEIYKKARRAGAGSE
ncbi:MAG TPA: GNAT family N-acetyltransferase [Terriglobia bacterium]|nr:GNAT family N-acetyltransferase [Terriglobia bacterium]